MFIPYRARIKVTRFPTMTVVVTPLCLLVYWAQERNERRIVATAEAFCAGAVAADIESGQRQYIGSDAPCRNVLLHTYLSSDPERHLQWHVDKIRAAGDAAAAEALVRHYRAFAAQAPPYLTERLVHYSGGWNPLRLLTSTIAHANWDHVIGNLFFFLAFALVVETVIGPVLFMLVFLAMGLSIGALENLLTATREGGSSLGLSGVVMGMMTLAAWFAPHVKIRYFYFFFLFFGVLSFPLWGVAAWYVFWNIYDQVLYSRVSLTDYAAHLAGAAIGLAFGLTLFRGKRQWVEERLVPDEPTLRDEESWLAKLNAFGATPVMMYMVFTYGFAAFVTALYLIVKFFETFAVQVLLAAPAAAAMIQLYRMKQPAKPLWQRYRDGLSAFESQHWEQALKILGPLAGEGYPRAQLTLGRLYATAPGAWRNEREAVRWFEAAAQRGLAEAQYELGARHMHGHALPKDLPRAVDWLERAAAQGLAQAANSLGHLYENMLGSGADREKAIEWYYRAGVAFHKAGRHDDALAVIRHLGNLAGKYPAVLGLVAQLEKLAGSAGPRA